jgi:hypothetical protein
MGPQTNDIIHEIPNDENEHEYAQSDEGSV